MMEYVKDTFNNVINASISIHTHLYMYCVYTFTKIVKQYLKQLKCRQGAHKCEFSEVYFPVTLTNLLKRGLAVIECNF